MWVIGLSHSEGAKADEARVTKKAKTRQALYATLSMVLWPL